MMTEYRLYTGFGYITISKEQYGSLLAQAEKDKHCRICEETRFDKIGKRLMITANYFYFDNRFLFTASKIEDMDL